jgi:hypothetical protein
VRGVRPTWSDESLIDRNSVARADPDEESPDDAKRVGGGGPEGPAQVDDWAPEREKPMGASVGRPD